MNRFLQGLANSVRAATGTWFPSMWNGMSAPSVSGKLNVPGINRPAENSVTVYAALNARMSAVLQAPLRIGDAKGNIATGGDLFELLQRPSLRKDGTQYLAEIEGYRSLYDMFAVAKVSATKGGKPDELIVLNPMYLIPLLGVHEPTGTAVAINWTYIDPWMGTRRTFEPDELILQIGFNPHAPLRPLAPTIAAMRALQNDIATHESNLAIHLNGGVPDVVLTTDQKLLKEQAEERLIRWNDRNSGFMNSHRAAILDAGLKPAKLGLTPLEMQYLEGLRWTRGEILTAMRVMPAMCGIMDGETGLSQGSSTQEQFLMWWENVGLAELACIAGAHNAGLMRSYKWTVTSRSACAMELRNMRRSLARAGSDAAPAQIYFDENQIPALVRQRLAKIDQFTKVLVQGYRPDDINEYLDLGLPEHPTNVGMIPFSVQNVEDLAEPKADAPSAIAPTSKAGDGGDTATEEAEESAEKIARAFGAIARAIATPEVRALPQKHAAHAAQYQQSVKSLTKACARKVSGFFVDQRGRVMRVVGGIRLLSSDVCDQRDSQDPVFLESGGAKRSISKAMRDVGDAFDPIFDGFDSGEENSALVKKVLGAWTEGLKSGWQMVNAQVGTDENLNPFTVDDPRIQAAIDARKIQAAKMNETTAEDLRGIIRDGVNDGLSTAEIGDNIAGYYSGIIGSDSARSMTAARTQMAGIVNDGQMASARAAGGVKKIWIHGNPAEARPAHLDAQSRYADGIELDAKFRINGVDMDAPGDADADISETANCTCCVGFIK